MDSGIEYQLSELIATINKAMKFGSSPFSSPGTGGQSRADGGGNSGFHKSVKDMTGAFGMMHKGTDDFIYDLQSMVGNLAKTSEAFIGLELAIGAFKEILHIGKTFSKMTDIGQNFNGSLFTMMEQVGKSGLSLDQFSAMMSRNSMTSATMGKSLGSLQMAVRDNLQQFGFYGMALDEITNTTSDYMETMRESGRLGTLDATQQTKAVTNLIAESSGLAKAFGKSREEIIKSTNETMRQTNLAARLSIGTQQQTDAVQSFITMYAGQSKLLASSFGEQYGKGGYVENELGTAAIGSGMGGLNNVISQSITAAKNGQKMTAGMMADQMSEFDHAFSEQQVEQLEVLSKGGNADAMKMLQFNNEIKAITRDKKFLDDTGKFNKEKYAKYIEQSKKDAEIQAGITQTALTFESSYKKITGGFIEGFYGAFASMLGDGVNLEASMQGLHDVFLALGKVVGGLLGIITKVVSTFGLLYTGVNYVVIQLKKFFGFGTQDDEKKDNTTGGLIGGLGGIVATVVGLMYAGKAAGMMKNFMLHGVASGVGGAGAGGGGLVAGATTGVLGFLSKFPGLKWLKKAAPEAGELAGAAASKIGAPNDCCDDIISLLTGIHGSINLHGGKSSTVLKSIEEGVIDAAKGGATAGGIAEMEGAAGGKAAGFMGRMLSKVTSKLPAGMVEMGSKFLGPLSKLTKFLPGIGLAVTSGFAIERAAKGDYLGAMGEVASGIVGLIPGFGLVGEGLIQAGLALYDNTKEQKKANDADPCDIFATKQGSILAVGHETTGTTTNQKDADKERQDTITSQMARMTKMKADLEAKTLADQKGNDSTAVDADTKKTNELLEQIAALNLQQTKLQKDTAAKAGTNSQLDQAFNPAFMMP
jgi:hypothetical protein